MEFFEISAKENININELMERMIEMIMEKRGIDEDKELEQVVRVIPWEEWKKNQKKEMNLKCSFHKRIENIKEEKKKCHVHFQRKQ